MPKKKKYKSPQTVVAVPLGDKMLYAVRKQAEENGRAAGREIAAIIKEYFCVYKDGKKNAELMSQISD